MKSVSELFPYAPLKSASDFYFSHSRAGDLYRKGARFYGPLPNVLCLPFVCGRVLTKEYFISEKWENTKTKENSQRRPNSNSLVMKQSQGSLVPSQGLSIIFWVISCELSYKYWNPHQVENLATWWPDSSHDISCHSSKNWPQGNGNKLTLELKINHT